MKSAREQLDDANTRMREAGTLRLPDDSTRYPDEEWGSDLSGGGATSNGKLRVDGEDAGGLVEIEAVDIRPTEVEWLWHNRIPLGKLSIISGLPDKR